MMILNRITGEKSADAASINVVATEIVTELHRQANDGDWVLWPVRND